MVPLTSSVMLYSDLQRNQLLKLYPWLIMDGLVVKDLQKSFDGIPILRNISFDLNKGEVLALLGPSGSGKTTLLEIIAGLEQPDQGDVIWERRSLLGVPPHLRKFGLMFQEYVLFPHKNVSENIAFGLKMAGTEREITRERVGEVLKLVGLEGFQERDPATLSGGEQQRVALARSLAPQPRLVMLDEPLGALDRGIRERLVSDLREILKKASQTALYVTHDQEEAFMIADRVVILGEGKAAQIGTPREIYYHPASAYVANFLGMTNLIPGEARTTPSGATIQTELGSWPVSEPLHGTGTVLIRPDRFQIGEEPGAGQAGLKGKLISSTFGGSVIDLKIENMGTQLSFSCQDAGCELPPQGSEICLRFSPDDALIFYPD